MRVLRTVVPALVAFPLIAQTGWRLTWSDEFNGDSLDTNKWVYATGGNGWGNNELEYYTSRPENTTVANGMLVITARREDYGGRLYTSARIRTEGKFSQAYGRFEARIKIPYGQGIWPAFWMMGEDISTVNWPTCGEIDVMENIGREPGTVYGTMHGPPPSAPYHVGSSYTLPGGARLADDFHIYGVEWEPNVIRWYLDGVLYFTATPANVPEGKTWVFNKPFHMLLNVAVGGNWPGNPDSTTVFPQTMQVDWVRVYERDQESAGPAIVPGGVVNGASFLPQIAPGSWVSLFGTGMASTTRDWRPDEIVEGRLPHELDGTSVYFNGKAAAVSYVSPLQVNVQAPDTGPGPVVIEVANNGRLSERVTAEATEFAPAFFMWPLRHVVATGTDSSPLGPPGLFPDVTTRPAHPGETVVLWGTGFGPTDPPYPAGQLGNSEHVTMAPVVRVGGREVEFVSGVLPACCASVYRIQVKLPDDLAEGDLPVVAEVGGKTSAENVILTVAR